MYQFVILFVVFATTSASPGNLGLGYGGIFNSGYSTGGVGLAGGYGGNQVAVSSGSIAAAPLVAAVPYVAAAPVATSSQARVDLNGPTQVVTQIAAALPVTQLRAGGYGGAAGASGLGYGGSAGGVAGLAGLGGHRY